MSLIKSISGIRGTIGGKPGEGLTPLDIVRFVSAYSEMLGRRNPGKQLAVAVGRDARMSGETVASLVCRTLTACGINVTDIGMATTPTTELAVRYTGADGGIIVTASHNPRNWNALKLLNGCGEFFTAADGAELLDIAEKDAFEYAEVEHLGKIAREDFAIRHIEDVMKYSLVDVEAIRKSNFKVVLDPINSVGGVILPQLFDALDINYVAINCEPDGNFIHNPEPLPANLTELSKRTVKEGADLGIAVDPDVDRLAFICEDGTPFGEEYTLVAVADYILSQRKGPACSNLSSSRALDDVCEKYGCKRYVSAVGEVNVSTLMKEKGAVIGGEGNGGVIVPDFHYGRDALIGIALFLTNLAHKHMKMTELRGSFPKYAISKNRVDLPTDRKVDVNTIYEAVKKHFEGERFTEIDGLKVDIDSRKQWLCVRTSNTEPIMRVYSEAGDEKSAQKLADEVIKIIKSHI
jgi:phosphoglucosamine mutase